MLDLGCGRGEFLGVAQEAGLAARGIDQNEECIALCRAKGLEAEQNDLFSYLSSLPDGSLGGAFCSHVVEHLPPGRLPNLVHLLARKLRAGAMTAIETPNPAAHFYIDPTHTRPVPPVLLRFYLEEAGFGNIEIERLSPVSDYAIFARKLWRALVVLRIGHTKEDSDEWVYTVHGELAEMLANQGKNGKAIREYQALIGSEGPGDEEVPRARGAIEAL